MLRKFPYCKPGLETSLMGIASGICAGGVLRGRTEITTRDGMAVFTELAISGGLPGAYQLSFEVFGSTANATAWISVMSGVAGMLRMPLTSALRASGGDVAFDSSGPAPWPLSGVPPKVRVVTVTADPSLADNLTVYAVSIDAQSVVAAGELGNIDAIITDDPASTDAPPRGGGVVFANNAAVTSGGGVADFSGLRLGGYVRPHAMLAFVCEGNLLVWSETRPQPASDVSLAPGGAATLSTIAFTRLPAGGPAVTPASVKVLVQPPTSVVEGQVAFLRLSLPASLAGTSVIATAHPHYETADRAAAPASTVEQQHYSEDPGWPSRF